MSPTIKTWEQRMHPMSQRLSASDEKITCLLAEAADLRAALAAKTEVVALNEAVKTLERISRWFGEFPETNRACGDGTPMSYGAAFGSNGERDYMREVAKQAIAAISAPAVQQGGDKVESYCLNCRGEGCYHTGIDEAPVTQCKACNGSGVTKITATKGTEND